MPIGNVAAQGVAAAARAAANSLADTSVGESVSSGIQAARERLSEIAGESEGCEYIVEGAEVFCTKGEKPTNMIASCNCRAGCEPVIVDTDTIPGESFEGYFGECTTRKFLGHPEPYCEGFMELLPKWLEVKEDYLIDGGEKPHVTVQSFAICIAGLGIILPLEHGQSKDDFDFAEFMRNNLLGILIAIVNAIDPVNTSTGNFFYSKDDIEIPGRFPLVFKRFYNVMGDTSGSVGKNWTHNYNIQLKEDVEGRTATITFGDGHSEEYYRRADGSYMSPPDRQNTLKKCDNGYVLTFPSMETYKFDDVGNLLSISDLNSNTTQFIYKDGLLHQVSNDCGSLTFEYNRENQITKITDNSGRVAFYEYEESLLIAATNTLGATYRYEYGDNRRINKVINPLGIATIFNEYDEKKRAVKQTFPDGGFASMRYEEDKPHTILTEQNGNEVVYVRDKQFRTTGIIYDDSSERFAYNQNNKRTLHVDRNGNTRRYTYDTRGNLTKETDPLGGVTAIAYNTLNKPINITLPNGGITEVEYDQKGNILKVADPLKRELNFKNDNRGLVSLAVLPDGSESAIEYDNRGNIIALTDGNNMTTRYEYDNLNRVVKTTNGEGHVTLFAYTGKGDIKSVTNAEGKVRRYEYNLSGKVTKLIDFDGSSIEYKYNSIGKVEEITDQSGGVTKLSYDLMWNVTSVTNPLGHTVKYIYDMHQRVVQTVDEEGNITNYEHDPKGNVIAVVSPIGGRTEISYDALDRQVKIIEPDGAITLNEYDSVGNVVAVTDALGNATKREYDLAGQMVKLIDPLGNETKFTYTPLGQVESVTDPCGGKTTYSYYPGGKLESVVMPSKESQRYEYDKNGNTIAVTDSLGARTQIKYDRLDRAVETIDPLGCIKKFSYDALGNIIEITDEKGNLTQYKYSLLGDVVEVIDANGHSTKYGYDAMRRLTKLEQFRMIDGVVAGLKMSEYQITTYERNKKGEVVEVKSPLGNVVKLGYNAVGNLTSKLDEDGLETLYEYDLANKLTKVSYADGKTVELGYNALKQLTAMKDWLGMTKVEVDPLGRATKVIDPLENEVAYKWNALGQKEALIYPDGKEVGYEYDVSGRLKKVKSQEGVTNYSYDTMGRLSERVLPDNTVTKYEMNLMGRLTGLVHSRNGDILDQFKYTYDPAGNITQIEKHRAGMEADSGVFEYAYDPLGRLTAAVKGEQVKRYRYDELGNRVKEWGGHKHDPVEWTQHSYNARNQLVKTQAGDAVTEYRYDGRGNLTNISENGQLKSRFEFDATNMMVGAFTAGKGTAEYTYNGFRNRVAKLENMSKQNYILDMTLPYDNLLSTQGDKKQNFVWGNGLISSLGDESFSYLQDHLGSPIRVTGSDFEEVLAYDEFGKNQQSSRQPFSFTGEHLSLSGGFSDSSQPFGFTGYVHDSASGMYYAQNRYYQSTTGRFNGEDGARDGLNWYSYCDGNPIRYIDPSGLTMANPWAANIGNSVSNWISSQSQSSGSWQAAIQPSNICPDVLAVAFDRDRIMQHVRNSGYMGDPMNWEPIAWQTHFPEQAENTPTWAIVLGLGIPLGLAGSAIIASSAAATFLSAAAKWLTGGSTAVPYAMRVTQGMGRYIITERNINKVFTILGGIFAVGSFFASNSRDGRPFIPFTISGLAGILGNFFGGTLGSVIASRLGSRLTDLIMRILGGEGEGNGGHCTD